MNERLPPAYGSRRLALLYHDIKDRLSGHKARANARWGWVRPPRGQGRVIWLRAGGSRASVALAADLLAAIRDKRQDVRLVLTFQHDYPEIYAPRLQGLRKIGVGYGHCDTPGAVRRVFRRLEPFAVIAVGEAPGPHFLAYLEGYQGHSLAFQLEQPPAGGHFELACPGYGQRYGHCAHSLPACDMHSLLVQAQVEPSLGGILRGADEALGLYWLAGVTARELPELLAAWRAHALSRRGLLCLSPAPGEKLVHQDLLDLADWPRQAVPAATVLLANDGRWQAAVAASANATHLGRVERASLWQALAGGAPVSLDPGLAVPALAEFEALPRLAEVTAVFDHWQRLGGDALASRRQGDAARRLFWQVRRQAAAVSQDMLQRIYDW